MKRCRKCGKKIQLREELGNGGYKCSKCGSEELQRGLDFRKKDKEKSS
ncbi:MAG: hypothetical protein ACOC1X_01310 [Promethearchaeota archaeon]